MDEKQTIESYLNEMLDWETSLYKLMRTSQYKNNENNCKVDGLAQARLKLKNIIEKYLTIDAQNNLGEAALSTMAVGNPPRYQQIFFGSEIKGKLSKVIFKSENGGLQMPYCKYVLSAVDDKWLIKEIYSSIDNIKWIKNKGL